MRPAGFNQILAFYFRPQGRIGRMEFALGAGFVWFASMALLLFLLRSADDPSPLAALIFLLSLPLSVGLAILVVKRCHDIGLSGAFMLLMFVPLIGIVWMAALLFIPGDTAPNLYGAPPRFRSE